jgi:uncharacterized membrane protein
VADDSEPGAPGSTQSAEPEDGTPSVERLLTLSDGVVAIALTLLVLQLAVPTIEGVSGSQAQSPGYLWKQLSSARGDQFTAYVVSFYVIAQFWLTHHRVFRSIQGHVEGLAWWNFAFLFTITLMPFSSDLLGRFSENPLAIDLFALNILLASLATQGVVYFARRHGLQSGEEDPKALRSTHFRVLWIYTVIVATAALAWIAPRWAMIGWLLLVSAPRIGEIMAKRFPGPLRSPAGLA